MLKFKAGVSLRDLQPQMLVALEVVKEAFASYALDTIVTSANDSIHFARSYHYTGRALDFRTHHAAGIAKTIIAQIRETLAPLGFDVLFEDVGKPNEHLHIELDRVRAGY